MEGGKEGQTPLGEPNLRSEREEVGSAHTVVGFLEVVREKVVAAIPGQRTIETFVEEVNSTFKWLPLVGKLSGVGGGGAAWGV